MALQHSLVGQGLGHMALAGARFAHDQGVGSFGDERQGVQLKAGRARQLGVKASPLKNPQTPHKH
jgi:hypothetical protein